MTGTDEVTAYRRKSGIRQYFKSLEVVDYRLIVSILFLMMFGLIMVYSATNATAGSSTMIKQAAIGLIGLLMMIVVSYIDYHLLAKMAGVLYLLSILSLFLVRVPGIGVLRNGAYRWVELGPVQFQPSELVKPAIVILMAYLLTQVGRKLTYFRADVFIMLPGLIAVVLILAVTRNLSTALIVLGIMVLMFFVAHPNKKIWGMVIIGLLLLLVLWLMYYHLYISPQIAAARSSGGAQLSSFRAGRILAWLCPDLFSELSMQSRYSLYAIGFGGVLGRGLGHGTMKYYIPECDNDFIFAVIGEELGLVGCAMVIFLFIYQIWRIMVVAQHAKDYLGGYIAFGIGAHVALQAIMNIGVATSVFPNTGISLPYISSGGTALLLQLIEMGIVLNVSKQIPGKKVLVEGGSSVDTASGGRRRRRSA